GAFAAITLTMLLASNQGPSGASASSTRAANVLASLVSFTDGRACRPTSWVTVTCAWAVFDMLSLLRSGSSAGRQLVRGRYDVLQRPSSNASATVRINKALERAPGSRWPIERSPRKEARPRVAFIGLVSSAAASAIAASSKPDLPAASAAATG